jgi:hypothetical protein
MITREPTFWTGNDDTRAFEKAPVYQSSTGLADPLRSTVTRNAGGNPGLPLAGGIGVGGMEGRRPLQLCGPHGR